MFPFFLLLLNLLFSGDWEEGDIPMNEHRKLFPMCGFVQGRDVGNVEIGEEGDVEEQVVGGQEPGPGHDEAGTSIYFYLRLKVVSLNLLNSNNSLQPIIIIIF